MVVVEGSKLAHSNADHKKGEVQFVDLDRIRGLRETGELARVDLFRKPDLGCTSQQIDAAVDDLKESGANFDIGVLVGMGLIRILESFHRMTPFPLKARVVTAAQSVGEAIGKTGPADLTCAEFVHRVLADAAPKVWTPPRSSDLSVPAERFDIVQDVAVGMWDSLLEDAWGRWLSLLKLDTESRESWKTKLYLDEESIREIERIRELSTDIYRSARKDKIRPARQKLDDFVAPADLANLTTQVATLGPTWVSVA